MELYKVRTSMLYLICYFSVYTIFLIAFSVQASDLQESFCLVCLSFCEAEGKQYGGIIMAYPLSLNATQFVLLNVSWADCSCSVNLLVHRQPPENNKKAVRLKITVQNS